MNHFTNKNDVEDIIIHPIVKKTPCVSLPSLQDLFGVHITPSSEDNIQPLSYMEMSAQDKMNMVNYMKQIVFSSMTTLCGEESSSSLLADLIISLSPPIEEPNEEPDMTGNEQLYPLSFVPVQTLVVQTLEDNVIRAMLSTPTKTGGEYRALRAALAQTHDKKAINEMLKKWQVLETNMEDDGHEDDITEEANRRLRINADEYRAALYDYNVLTSSNSNRLVQTFPEAQQNARKRRSSSEHSSFDNSRRGIVSKFKNMLLQEFIRTNGNFSISDAVTWLKNTVPTLEEDFPSDKQIRGYVSILRMAQKKTGTLPPLKAEMI